MRIDPKDVVTEPVPIRRVAPQRGYWEVRARQYWAPKLFVRTDVYDNRGNLVADDYAPTPEVSDWLKVNAPGCDVMIDRGDWGEGDPDLLIRFRRKKHAEAFITAFDVTWKTVRR